MTDTLTPTTPAAVAAPAGGARRTTPGGADVAEMVRRLPDGELDGFRRRAAEADRDNTYFHEDLRVLSDAGYLRAAVPTDLGGLGADLRTMAAAQRRIARYAPSTALATCMHHYWVGIATELRRLGDTSLEWLLREVAGGAVLAAGHAERGNDVPVLMSTTVAERVDGGYRLNGHKMFGSNGPVWNLLGVHAIDMGDPENPTIVHGFVRRDDAGVEVVETWDTLGMRPSQSHDTVLTDVFLPDERVGCVAPAGSGEAPFLVAMDAWALPLMASVYLGIADRAIELAIESATTKTSVAIPRGLYAHNPMVQHQIAEMVLAREAADAVVARYLDDWVGGIQPDEWWGLRTVAAKWHAVEATKRVVDRALDVTGGAGMFRGNELERLYRDARCGGFHPANDALTHESVAKVALGLDPAGDRW